MKVSWENGNMTLKDRTWRKSEVKSWVKPQRRDALCHVTECHFSLPTSNLKRSACNTGSCPGHSLLSASTVNSLIYRATILSMPTTSRPRRSQFKPNPLALIKSFFSSTTNPPASSHQVKPVRSIVESEVIINDHVTSRVGIYVLYIEVYNLIYLHISICRPVARCKRLTNHLQYVLRSTVILLL